MDRQFEKYHFIGIGGIGMSALARILLDKKIPVSGSDLSSSDTTSLLMKKGAAIRHGHSAKHVSPDDIVVYTSSIHSSNPELQAAMALKCVMMHRSELLAHLMKDYQTLAIAGSHGKTTTSSLLTTVLTLCDCDPTFAVGGLIGEVNGKWGQGPFFVAEADESDGTFLNYNPDGAILTNISAEHMDYYKTFDALVHAFETFISQTRNPERLFYCGDDPVLKRIAKGKGLSYGFQKECDLRILRFRQEGWQIFFDLAFDGQVFADLSVPLIGEHNALNAAAVFGMALSLGLEEEKVRKALAAFPGVSRRCQKRGEAKQVLLIDDYGHHPVEIEKTLKALKMAVEEKRVVVLFQPHRFTRVRDLLEQFSKAFDWADHLYVTDIYSAGEEPINGIHAQTIVEKIGMHASVPCEYVESKHCLEKIKKELRPHDVLVILGAGDAYRLHGELMHDFSPTKLTVGLVFGGLSCEHEISLRSSRFIADSLDRDLYDIVYFGIDKEGRWVIGEEAKLILENQPVVSSSHARHFLDPIITKELMRCDLFLPILHGTYGEDGTIQGFFEMLGKPYIGPDNRSAAIAMDKVLTKRLVSTNGVPTPNDLYFSYIDWLRDKEALMEKIFSTLNLPLYVKPIHLGSSVGITKVEEQDQLEKAIDFAFRFDTQVMVEEGKVGCRELEFAVVGNTTGFRIDVPPPGEKLAAGEFVDYEKKYGMQSVKTTLYPNLDQDVLQKGKELAKRAYLAAGSSGMTRVDFLLDPQGNYWFFEMNPIPGMQKLSLFPKIWQREGVEPGKLLDRLIILAMHRRRQQDRHFKTLNACSVGV